MSIFRKIFGSSTKSNKAKSTATKKPAALQNDEAGTSVDHSDDHKADFKLLLSLYKKHHQDEVDFNDFIKAINPEATPHKCPYCEVVHEFTASRARKCPECSNKMIVRQGVYLSENQIEKLEEKTSKFYTKQELINRLGYELETAQDNKVRKEWVTYYKALAEAFRFVAQVDKSKDPTGRSFWDKAWSYYNKARHEEIKGLRKDMMEYSALPDLFWSMSQMLLDEANTNANESNRNRTKKKALTYGFMTLAEAEKLGADPYFVPEVYEFTKRIINELSIPDEEVELIAADVATRIRVTGANLARYNKRIKAVKEFEIIR